MRARLDLEHVLRRRRALRALGRIRTAVLNDLASQSSRHSPIRRGPGAPAARRNHRAA